MAKSLFEELGGKIRKGKGDYLIPYLTIPTRRRTGNRHLGATAFRLSKTVP